jgi:dihydroorotate dehydrogenase
MELNSKVWSIFRDLMFHFDAEHVHHSSVLAIKALGNAAPFLLERLSGVLEYEPPLLRPEVFGLKFSSALGLAAGFDKNAELVSMLPHLGFGFCEIGTVTPLPQPGNPRPRLSRDPQTQSLFNRMGFNNDGSIKVAQNLEQHKKNLPPYFRVGVNIGKNKDTEASQIATDYALAAEPFLDLADFFVINVSSPNTPGLRSLQAAQSLAPIIDAVLSKVNKSSRKISVLVKLAPELHESELMELVYFFEQSGVAGLVLTNTLGGETSIGTGGWSGGLVRSHSAKALSFARSMTKIPIISVGGIDSAEVGQERLNAGANLLEIYSSWVFGGPRLPAHIAMNLR